MKTKANIQIMIANLIKEYLPDDNLIDWYGSTLKQILIAIEKTHSWTEEELKTELTLILNQD